MNQAPTIPKPSLERLFLYYRILEACREGRKEVISSEELGRRAGVDAAQVRKDLTYISQCGRPGIGYQVGELLVALEAVLGLKRQTHAALVGVGRLGTAIHNYPGFTHFGLRITALFDIDPARVGQRVGEHEIYHIDRLVEIVSASTIQLGIITVPAHAAQAVANGLIAAGVRGLWNFAPVTLRVPPGVIVRNEDLAVGLATLSWHLARSAKPLVSGGK
ncbi:MAG: redox-sensing transcriptional repressor Rex [Bacillota bacterium]|nr:redox-sensing transcriptional repressor Rex [Bacillota bacterium]